MQIGTAGIGDDISLFFSQYLTSFANETYSINVRNTGVSTRGGVRPNGGGLRPNGGGYDRNPWRCDVTAPITAQ